jgi:SSS family solute:Na+ symporter
MLAGFLTKTISATAAKAALIIGLTFYILTTFIFPVDIHFVHVWGIEFVLNVVVMFGVSYWYPQSQKEWEAQPALLDLKTWKYTTHFSISLCVIPVLMYVLLGS